MPSGIQVFAENTSIVLDTNDRMTFILGSFVTQKGQNGSVQAEFNGRPSWAQVIGVGGYFGSSGAPVVTISGNTLSWTWDYPNASRSYQCPSAFIVYGAY